MSTELESSGGLRSIIRRNKFYILISLSLILATVAILYFRPGFGRGNAQALTPGADSTQVNDTLTVEIAFVGDMMGHMPVVNSGLNPETKRYDYAYCFPLIKPYFESVDLVIGNFETTLDGEPYHGFPMFSTPDDYARSHRDNGIRFFVTANNHSYDRGKTGINRTIHVLDSLGIEHTGTFEDSTQRNAEYPYFKEINGMMFAILNYTFSTNGLKVYPPSIVNMIDSNQMKQDVEKAKSQNPDYILVILHWGVEYASKPHSGQKVIASYLAELGVDAIIGAHPHVVQTVEFIKRPDSVTVPVVYSMGNFLSNQRDRYKDGGLIPTLTFRKIKTIKQAPELEILPFWLYKKEGPSKYYVVPEGVLEHQPGLIQMSATDKEKALLFFSDTRKLIPNAVYSDWYMKNFLDSATVQIGKP